MEPPRPGPPTPAGYDSATTGNPTWLPERIDEATLWRAKRFGGRGCGGLRFGKRCTMHREWLGGRPAARLRAR